MKRRRKLPPNRQEQISRDFLARERRTARQNFPHSTHYPRENTTATAKKRREAAPAAAPRLPARRSDFSRECGRIGGKETARSGRFAGFPATKPAKSKRPAEPTPPPRLSGETGETPAPDRVSAGSSSEVPRKPRDPRDFRLEGREPNRGETCPMGGIARASNRSEHRIDFLRILRSRGYRTCTKQKPNL